jgi:predicted transposase
MKLTLQIRLLPDPDQRRLLLTTMERFNAAATHAARVGFQAKVFSQPSIHGRCYRELREQFGLSAQMAAGDREGRRGLPARQNPVPDLQASRRHDL